MSDEATSTAAKSDPTSTLSVDQLDPATTLIIMATDSSEASKDAANKSTNQIPKIVIQPALGGSQGKKRAASIEQYQGDSETPKYARLELVQSDLHDGNKSYENLENALNSVTTSAAAQPAITVQYTQVNPIQVPPKLTHTSANTEEIYQLLSQKIAKYCQVLSDLTNCEVFFKSTLNQRSLYWGTYKMMYTYSHQGLHYDRNESLIKIMGRSLSNDVNNIVEELLAPENLDETSQSELNTSVNYTILSQRQSTDTNYTPAFHQGLNVSGSGAGVEIATALTPAEIEMIDVKDCVVFADRLDDGIFEEYLQKLEKNKTYVDDEAAAAIESEIPEVKDESLGGDEMAVANNDDMFICELCADRSYKHLPQLKMHIIKEHEKVAISEEGPYDCVKCHSATFSTKEDYSHHLLLCFYPDLYTCKMCQQNFENYSEFLFHTRYIHTQAYVCSMCNRKFKNVKELVDHDQLMHAKALIYCEICYEQMKSRSELYRHYKSTHIANLIQSELSSDTSQLVLAKDSQGKMEEMILDAATGSQLNITSGSVISLNDSTSLIVTEESNASGAQQQILTPASLNTARVQKNDLIRGLLDRKHQCKWCTQRFYTKAQLKQHESSHVNAVLYCPVCDKEFTHKDRLAGHMKCHMEPSLECKICGKKFKRLCNLYNHELVHGLTEHAFMLCQFCGRGFRSRRDYQNHVIANHRDQLMKSEVIMKNGAGGGNVSNVAAAIVQSSGTPPGGNNVKNASNQEAKALFANQMTPIVTSSKAQPKSVSKRGGSSTADNSFTYFTHLTHGSNNSVAFDDENEMDDDENNQLGADDMDENVQESKQQAKVPLHNHVTRSQKKAAAAAAAAAQQSSNASNASSASSSNNLNNAQLLVQAAEFVDNQSA